MIMRRNLNFLYAAAVWVFALAFGSPAPADQHALIICGSGGTPEFETKFAGWGQRLHKVVVKQFGVPEQNVRLLMESQPSEGPQATITSAEAIKTALNDFALKITPEDDFYVFLIGHGSFLRQISKLNIPGPDISAAELRPLLDSIPARRTVIVNAASASAAFINELSAPNRVIVTATKSATERNATTFMEFFLQAVEEGSADLNRDERISVTEACRQAAALTEAWYASENLIPTEHALLDDNADGLGSRLLDMADLTIRPDGNDPIDGYVADTVYFKDYEFPDSVPKELVNRYLGTLQQVTELKRNKPGLDEAAYYADLEKLLIEAAKANREIRRMADESPEN